MTLVKHFKKMGNKICILFLKVWLVPLHTMNDKASVTVNLRHFHTVPSVWPFDWKSRVLFHGGSGTHLYIVVPSALEGQIMRFHTTFPSKITHVHYVTIIKFCIGIKGGLIDPVRTKCLLWTFCNLSSQHKMVLFNNVFPNKASIKQNDATRNRGIMKGEKYLWKKYLNKKKKMIPIGYKHPFVWFSMLT